MDTYSRLFIKASVIYLAIGVLFGLHMAVADHAQQQLRFVHIHLLLLGFMAMMIYGVAYHILPRFNAKPVPYPILIPVHFWLSNIGLIGMSILFMLGAFWAEGGMRYLFGLFGLIEATAIFIFAFNMLIVLKEDKEETSEPATVQPVSPPAQPKPAEPDTAEKIKIDPSMKIAEILDKWPALGDVLGQHGMGGLTSPAVRQSAAKVVTLKMAVTKAGADLGEVLAALEGGKILKAEEPGESDAPSHPEGFLPVGHQIKRGEQAKGDTQVGTLLEVYPETKEVFARRYGEACFTCPGQKTETVEQTAMMHGASVDDVVGEINAAIDKALNN